MDLHKLTNPDLAGQADDGHNVLSMQADIISVLSGHSHSRSAMKNKNTRGDRKIKFTNNNAPMS